MDIMIRKIGSKILYGDMVGCETTISDITCRIDRWDGQLEHATIGVINNSTGKRTYEIISTAFGEEVLLERLAYYGFNCIITETIELSTELKASLETMELLGFDQLLVDSETHVISAYSESTDITVQLSSIKYYEQEYIVSLAETQSSTYSERANVNIKAVPTKLLTTK
jgi:hypothetical protein